MRYGDLIRQARRRAGLSQATVAAALKIGTGFLSDVERGDRGPFNAARTERFAFVTGADIEALCEAALAEREPEYWALLARLRS